MENKYLKNIVAFCILMENNDGILGKSPDYIMEKFERYCLSVDTNTHKWGLDFINTRKLETWIERWEKNGK